MLCDKFCVLSGKCMSIIVKIKCVNSDNMSDICDKLKFTTTDTHYIKLHTHITIFDI